MIYLCNAIVVFLTIFLVQKKVPLLYPSAIFYWISIANLIAIQLIYSGLTISPKVLYDLTGSYYSAMPLNFTHEAFNASLIQYFFLSLFGWLITIFFSWKQVEAPSTGFNLRLPEWKMQSALIPTLLLISLCAIYTLHFFSIDLSLLWRNNSYLLLEEPEKLGLTNGLIILFHFLLRITGLFTAGLTLHYFFKRDYLNLTISAILFTYTLVFMLAQNSRWASLYFFMMLMYCQITKKGGRVFKSVLAVLCFIVFLKVLIGRASYLQGVSTILNGFFDLRIDAVYYYLIGSLINILEGATNFANAEQIAPLYELKYKFLSFSPFPSFIDGFSIIRDSYQVRITPYVPFSAFSEVRWFGGVYYILFYLPLLTLLVFANKIYSQYRGPAAFFLSGFICWITFMMNSYPVRNVFRSILIIIALMFIFDRIKKRNADQTLDRPPNLQGMHSARPGYRIGINQ